MGKFLVARYNYQLIRFDENITDNTLIKQIQVVL